MVPSAIKFVSSPALDCLSKGAELLRALRAKPQLLHTSLNCPASGSERERNRSGEESVVAREVREGSQ